MLQSGIGSITKQFCRRPGISWNFGVTGVEENSASDIRALIVDNVRRSRSSAAKLIWPEFPFGLRTPLSGSAGLGSGYSRVSRSLQQPEDWCKLRLVIPFRDDSSPPSFAHHRGVLPVLEKPAQCCGNTVCVLGYTVQAIARLDEHGSPIGKIRNQNRQPADQIIKGFVRSTGHCLFIPIAAARRHQREPDVTVVRIFEYLQMG